MKELACPSLLWGVHVSWSTFNCIHPSGLNTLQSLYFDLGLSLLQEMTGDGEVILYIPWLSDKR